MSYYVLFYVVCGGCASTLNWLLRGCALATFYLVTVFFEVDWLIALCRKEWVVRLVQRLFLRLPTWHIAGRRYLADRQVAFRF